MCSVAIFKSQLRLFRSQRFVKLRTHRVHIDQRDTFFPCHLSNCFWIVAVRVCDLSLLVECASLNGSDHYRNRSTLSSCRNKLLQVCLVAGKGANTLTLFFFIVVTVLNQ